MQLDAPANGDGERGEQRGDGEPLDDRDAAAGAALRLPGGAQHARAQCRVGSLERRVERDQVGDLLVLRELARRLRIAAHELLDGIGLGPGEAAERVGGEQFVALLGRHDRPPSR